MSKRPKMTAHHDQSLRAMDLTEDTTELYEELYQGPDDTNYQHDPKEEKNALAPFMINLFGRSVNYVVLAVHANIVLYSIFFWIQQGTMPYLIKKFEVDPAVFGYLQTTFAIVQLCGGPLFGRYGDLYGGQAALVLAFSSAALSYFILGMSFTVPMLFLSRLPSVFMHAMQGGQMVVTDMSEEKQRSDALGKLGLSYGIGFIVGPLVGGVLTKAFGEQFAAFVAASGSILSIVIVKMSIPKHTKLYHTEVHKEESTTAVFNMKKIGDLLQTPGTGLLLAVKTFTGIPIGIFQSMFPIVAVTLFKLEPEQNGYLMAYTGVLVMLIQGFGLGIVGKKFNDNSLIKLATFIMIWAYLALSYVTSVWQFAVVAIPLCFGLTTQNIVISSALTKRVPHADTGAILGVNMAMNSLIRTVSPTIGGIMLHQYGFPSFGYLGFVVCGIMSIGLFTKLKS